LCLVTLRGCHQIIVGPDTSRLPDLSTRDSMTPRAYSSSNVSTLLSLSRARFAYSTLEKRSKVNQANAFVFPCKLATQAILVFPYSFFQIGADSQRRGLAWMRCPSCICRRIYPCLNTRSLTHYSAAEENAASLTGFGKTVIL
jgi:hypothetical protein